LTSSPAALPTLQTFAVRGHILYGSDFPYAPASIGTSFTRKLDAYEMAAAEKAAINRGNALALFERLRG
jgi:aminocarboxymuconate-semialdehyde decarboxylase